MYELLDQFYVYGIQAFFSVLEIEFDMVIFFDLVNQSTCMNKSFFVGIIVLDEAESFVCVEKFYGACCFCAHC